LFDRFFDAHVVNGVASVDQPVAHRHDLPPWHFGHFFL
jgi:hypothetical protein